MLNPDVRLERGAVAEMASRLGEDVGIVVPRFVNRDGVLWSALSSRADRAHCAGRGTLARFPSARLGLGETIVAQSSYELEGDVDWATGAVMLISAGLSR